MFDGLNISSTGMVAESFRLSVVANNLANADTTVTPQGGPYRSEYVTFQSLAAAKSGPNAGIGQGVLVSGLHQDQTPFKVVYDPTSPQANAQGDVLYPNVNLQTQMVDMIEASQAYQANVSAFNSAKSMDLKALTIGS
ncbi:flagellar basal body rod protein FlgC [Sulfobacillus harzensis]|uniref:Flagellar basal-body rod protein FlgC n=1 Tax=Sulfobacillus harzensis TaxID=2729629 RepID=A0A7Y0L5E3_9FIRM|nr:flagellar basal body rod protein FlgC [Sulfobacillus harzensis]NMP23545.1 flagellar basal body rod protein FlgC [Sulfobacillus harzensis]